MFGYVLLGATYGFAAAAQPGQFQAFLLSRTARDGWRPTIPAALAPLLSDLPIVVLVLFVLVRVPPAFLAVLRLIGGGFLLYLAFGALSSWRRYHPPAENDSARAHETLLQAALVNFLNPSPYLAWSTVLGPLVIEAWRKAPLDAGGLVVAFYATMILATVAVIVVFALAHTLGPRVARGMVGVSAIALAAFGVYQLLVGTVAVRALGLM